MSTSPSIDAFDAQMLDFSSDPDVAMNITGSAEFFTEALMDHDGQLAAATYSEHASVEVDMEEYAGDNVEYEMADETTEYQRPHGDELLDVEVFDASHAPSPFVPPQPLQPTDEAQIEHPTTTSKHATLSALQGEPDSEEHPVPLDQPAADISHVGPSASGEFVASETTSSELAHPSCAHGESVPPVSESHEQPGNASRTDGQLHEVPAPADEADLHVPPVSVEHVANAEAVRQENLEPQMAESAPLAEDACGTDAAVQDEKATDEAPATEEETVDPLHISDGVYIDPPPAVLLSVAKSSEPEFALFNLPDVDGESTEESPNKPKNYSLLLESRPTLYYEPLSSVFEALRQDEGLLSRIPHSFEGELLLDAYELQLAVSEDNVHSREISLHDLNILHDGSNFAGPLRLLLRVIVPRFIIRFYALQEQIQRLHVVAETGEGEHDEEHHEHYDEEQPFPQQDETTDQSSTHATVVSESRERPAATEAGKSVQELILPPEPTDEAPQESCELEETSAAEEPLPEYHEAAGEVAHALEDENDYEGTNVDDEDESAKTETLDTDQVHDTVAEDTDAPGMVTGQESEFGGEQTEYLDYVQPEDYDERYDENLPERAGGASSLQYGEPAHYEEEGEQDTSTAVDETQAALPGSDEDEGDVSTATPMPARAVLEPESSKPDDVKATDQSVLTEENLTSQELGTSESGNEVDDVFQASDSQKLNTMQERIFSEVEESDSNFVAMLEREADAEFDRSFSAEQNGQGSIETRPQPIEIWEEDEWDDEDAEGVDEEDWIDPDADSNESSVTLSSKSSSKRSFDEVDPGEEPSVEDLQSSPGSKRPRVQ